MDEFLAGSRIQGRSTVAAILTAILSFALATHSNAASKNSSAIYAMNADGSSKQLLRKLKPIVSHTAKGHGRPYTEIAVSPNGKKLAFSLVTDPSAKATDPSDTDEEVQRKTQEIYVMNVDGSDLKRITNNSEVDEAPSWSPNSRKIVWSKIVKYVADPPGTEADQPVAQLFLANANGSGVTQLTDNSHISGDFDPQWSPDGSKILFSRLNADSLHLPSDFGFGPILATVSVDGGQVKRLPESESGSRNAKWSPKGDKIVFEEETARVVSSDGTGEKELSGLGSEPTWSPNGNRIAGVSRRACSSNGTQEIHTIAADGSDLENATHVGCRRPYRLAANPVWLNSKQIVFTYGSFTSPNNLKTARGTQKYFHIYKAESDGSRLTRLTDGKLDYVAPAVSPDGRKIYYVKAVRDL